MAKQYVHEALGCAGMWAKKTAQDFQMYPFPLCFRVITVRTLGGGAVLVAKTFILIGMEVKSGAVEEGAL